MNSDISFGPFNYTILFVYLAGMIGIGLWLARRQKTTEDYFLAGRRMPWGIVAMSIFASLTSAISYMGVPSRAYQENISMIAGFLIGPILAIFLVYVFFPFYYRLKVTTSYEYIDRRFGRPARFSVSALFLLARLGWLGTVIFAPSLALNIATGINLYVAIILMGVLATTYTTLGGLSAVLWTDVAQFVILVGGGIWVSISLLMEVPGGFDGIWAIGSAADPPRTGGFNWNFSLTELCAPAAMISVFFMTMQDYGTDQVTVQRLMSVRGFRGMAKAILTNSVFDILIIGMLLFMGMGLFAYYQAYPNLLDKGIKPDQILPFYIMQALPNGVSGLVITAIFAAAMSSMDSGIHSISTVVINDFVRPLRRTPLEDRADLALARTLVVIIGIVATVVAFWVSNFKHILEASATFVGLFNGPILALFLMGVLTRRAHFGGWLTGMVIAIGGTLYFQKYTSLHWYYYFPSSFAIAFVTGYVMSLLIPGRLGQPQHTLWGRHSLAATTGQDTTE